jgi:hypothetical protein
MKVEFDERKIIKKDHTKMVMKRSQKVMSTRWSVVQAIMNTFQGYHADIEQRPKNGTNAINHISAHP